MPPLKWTLKKIIKIVEEQGYEFIECISGTGNGTKIKVKCPNPNHEPYDVIFRHFNEQGTRCKKCCDERRIKWTDEKIKEYVKERGYEYLGKKGKGIASKIKVKCKRGHEYEVGLFAFSHECDCKQCFIEDNFTSIEEMASKVEQNNDKLIDILEYHGIETKLILYCDKCDRNYEKTYEKYCMGGKCPYCSESRGEKRVRRFLEDNNIEFITQYRTHECKNKYPLPFDFYVKIEEKEFAIEYDGMEHFQSIEFFGGEEKFKIRKENDKIKEDYCRNKNIELIRIPYWDFDNIEKILKEKLNLK